MKRGWILIFLCSLMASQTICAQNDISSDWTEIADQMSIDDEEEKGWDNSYEDLSELAQHPFNINVITKEQLERFPFLSNLQIEHLLYYLYVSGPMKTIYELQMVEDMDRQTIQYLLPFVYVGPVEKGNDIPSWRNIWKYGKHEIITRLDVPLNEKEGYKFIPDSVLFENENKHYLGSPYYSSVRYGFHYKDQIYFGLSAEKDAGEPFLAKGNKTGYDYYSFYFFARNLGNVKALALGNYRLSFGQGLVLNSDYSLGKSAAISTLNYKSGGIKKHSSMDEYNYFRGAAVSYKLSDFLVTAFYSHRDLDAIITDGVITSFKKDGMHRIPREIDRRNVFVAQTMGGNLAYSSDNLKLGFTGVYYLFDKKYEPEIKPYSYYNMRGRQFYNLGIDYKYRWKRIDLFGETALSQKGGIATINTLRFSPASGYQVLLLQRYYAKDYQAMYGKSVSEGSSVQNENGSYIGFEAKPIKFWKFTAYADFFSFPWLKYGVDKPSSGFDGLVQVTYFPKKNLKMFWRYRYKTKDKNYLDEETDIKDVRPYIQQKVRYQLSYNVNDNVSLKTTFDFTSANPQDKPSSRGYMLAQNLSYAFRSIPLKFDLNFGYFDTDDYSSRISSYEKGVLYAFSIPSFYGQGIRIACNLRYDFSQSLMIMAKFGQTRYLDKQEIGTGIEMIKGNTKSDINLQARYIF